jgi:hypothetical protein
VQRIDADGIAFFSEFLCERHFLWYTKILHFNFMRTKE